MYQQRNGRQLMMIGGGVVILVLLAGFFLTRGGGSSQAASAAPTSKVVVALQAIPQGTTFSAGQPLAQFFATQSIPTSIVPFGSYTSVNQISNLVRSSGCQPTKSPGCRGQLTVTQTIYQNLPVVSGMFSTLGQFRLSAGPAFQIPYGYVAIGINFSQTNSVLGSIQPGDDVDLMASLTGVEGQNGSKTNVLTQTQYALNDLRVIGVNGPPAPAPTGAGATSPSSSTSSTPPSGAGGQLLLLVRYQQALIIQHLKDFGGSWTTSVVLRSSKETDIPHFKTLPVTERWFFIKQADHFDFTNPY